MTMRSEPNESNRSQRLKWGVIGTGQISRQMVADLLLLGADVAAIVSRKRDSADAFADEFGVRGRFSDLDVMLASDIDVVYIGTPHTTHFEIASTALRAGKHVLCEKPLGMSAEEVRELARIASEQNLFLMEGMWMKFNPLFRRLSEHIEQGVIGEVRSARASFGLPFPRDDSSRWKPGGSALLDQGIYPVTIASLVFGEPLTVRAVGDLDANGNDLRENFTLGYSGGRFVQGASSMLEFLDLSASVSGTAGWITIDDGFWAASSFTIHRPFSGAEPTELVEVEQEGNGYVPMLRAVEEAIGSGAIEHPAHTNTAAAAAFDVLDAIRRQIA